MKISDEFLMSTNSVFIVLHPISSKNGILWSAEEEGEEEDQCGQIGYLLNFGQLFKAFGNNQFAQNYHILRQFL